MASSFGCYFFFFFFGCYFKWNCFLYFLSSLFLAFIETQPIFVCWSRSLQRCWVYGTQLIDNKIIHFPELRVPYVPEDAFVGMARLGCVAHLGVQLASVVPAWTLFDIFLDSEEWGPKSPTVTQRKCWRLKLSPPTRVTVHVNCAITITITKTLLSPCLHAIPGDPCPGTWLDYSLWNFPEDPLVLHWKAPTQCFCPLRFLDSLASEILTLLSPPRFWTLLLCSQPNCN